MMGAQAFPGYNYFSPFQGLHPYVFYCPGFEARFYCPGFEFGSKSFIGCRYSVGNVLSVGKQALHVRNEGLGYLWNSIECNARFTYWNRGPGLLRFRQRLHARPGPRRRARDNSDMPHIGPTTRRRRPAPDLRPG